MTLEEAAAELNMDLERVLDRMVNKRELLLRLMKAFVVTGDMEKARTAWQEKDYKCLEERVHSMKGAAGSLGFPDMFETSNELLQTVRRGEYDAVEEQFERMEDAYAQVCRVVGSLEE